MIAEQVLPSQASDSGETADCRFWQRANLAQLERAVIRDHDLDPCC